MRSAGPAGIEAAPLKQVSEWTEHYRHIWEERFDRLDAYLEQITTREKNHGRQQRSKRRAREDRCDSRSERDSSQVSTPSDEEIRMARLFNAPPELVFEVMSKP